MRDQQNLEATTSTRSLVGIIHNLSLFTSNPQLPPSSLAPLKPAYQSLCPSDARPSIRCYFRWHPQSHIRANSILHLPTASHITCEPNSLPDSDFRGSRLSSLQKKPATSGPSVSSSPPLCSYDNSPIFPTSSRPLFDQRDWQGWITMSKAFPVVRRIKFGNIGQGANLRDSGKEGLRWT